MLNKQCRLSRRLKRPNIPPERRRGHSRGERDDGGHKEINQQRDGQDA